MEEVLAVWSETKGFSISRIRLLALNYTRSHAIPSTDVKLLNASIAQSVEQLTFNQRVLGSSPSGGTDDILDNHPAPVSTAGKTPGKLGMMEVRILSGALLPLTLGGESDETGPVMGSHN